MRDISEYKLLGYYLLNIYEKTGTDNLKYEQVKSLTEKIFKECVFKNYKLLPIDSKKELIQKMISKGVFKTTIINGKQSFSQIYNYEISKYIYGVYSNDGSFTFKLPKEIKAKDMLLIQNIKKIYEANVGLDLQLAINAELNIFYKSIQQKNRNYA